MARDSLRRETPENLSWTIIWCACGAEVSLDVTGDSQLMGHFIFLYRFEVPLGQGKLVSYELYVLIWHILLRLTEKVLLVTRLNWSPAKAT